MLAGLLIGGKVASADGSRHRPSEFGTNRPPAVWLSIESPVNESVGPVSLPDYVLPDDGFGREESHDAGG